MIATLLSASTFGCGTQVAKKSRLASSQADSSALEAATTPVIGGRDLATNPNVLFGRPADNDLSEVLISRDEYVISWSRSRRTPNWVAWKLEDSDMGQIHRSNAFAPDPELESYLASTDATHAVTETDYRGSCFDRGHQLPSADRTANTAKNKLTFYMSNMIPQTAYLNRVTWEHLEEHERELVRGTDNAVYIIAGTIYEVNPPRIGPQQDIAVPSKNYKIIMDSGNATGKPTVLAAVIMPNTTSTGSDPTSDHEQACQDSRGSGQFMDEEPEVLDLTTRRANNDWEQWRTTVDAIEQEAVVSFSFLH